MAPRKCSMLIGAFCVIAVVATVVPLAIIQPWHKKDPSPSGQSNVNDPYLTNPYYQNPGSIPPGGSSPSSSNPQNAVTNQDSAQDTRGQMTYYAPGLGACGITSTENENICALSHVLYDAHNQGGNPNNNPLCGHKIRATHGGKSLILTVVDRCEACAAGDIDLSPGAFEKLEDLDEGRVPVTWIWLDPKPAGV